MTGPSRVPAAIRLLGKLVHTPDAGCWLTCCTPSRDRPRIGIGRRSEYASRVVLEAKLGRALGAGIQACHTCDNPACVRPEHLFEGTQADNVRDMEAKGRDDRSGQRKLSDGQVAEVRSLAGAGWRQGDIACAYGVSQPLVSLIATGGWRTPSSTRRDVPNTGGIHHAQV